MYAFLIGYLFAVALFWYNRQRILATRSHSLATEIALLPQTKIGKRNAQQTEKHTHEVWRAGLV